MRINLKNITKFISQEEITNNKENVQNALNTLVNKTGAGNDFIGWLRYPYEYNQEEYSRIKKLLKKSSAYSCGAGLAQWDPVNHVRRGTEQH